MHERFIFSYFLVFWISVAERFLAQICRLAIREMLLCAKINTCASSYPGGFACGCSRNGFVLMQHALEPKSTYDMRSIAV